MRSRDGLRIAMASARFPPMMGGTEVHVASVGARLAERGHDVTVLTTVLDPDEEGESSVDGMKIVRMRAWPRRSDLYLAPTMRRRVKAGNFDVVHVQGYHTFVAPAAMSGAVASETPFVVTFHSGGHSSVMRRSIRPLQHVALRHHLSRAHRLIAVSDFEGRYFRDRLRLHDDRFITVPNGVDDVFADALHHEKRNLVSSVGRLEEYKGHQHVIRAFAEVGREQPESSLRIIGTGPYESELRSLVAELSMSDRVEFCNVPPADRSLMAALLGESRVVALASSYESQGIVGSEALACGAGLVVVSGSALADLGVHPAVAVVPPDDVDALAAAIARQLREPPTGPPPTFPSWDDVAGRLEGVYREALSHPQPELSRAMLGRNRRDGRVDRAARRPLTRVAGRRGDGR